MPDSRGDMTLLNGKFKQSEAEIFIPPFNPRDPRALHVIKPYSGGKVDFGIAGVPYDGAVKGRKGARDAPDAVRGALRYNSAYCYDYDVDISALNVADFGNVVIPDGTVREVHEAVVAAVTELMSAAGKPILIGGDHSLTFPHLKAFSEARGGRTGIVTFDAHNDLRDYEGEDISSGTPFRRIIEELPGKPVDPGNIVQIGLHGFLNSAHYRDYAIERGINLFTVADVRSVGMANVMKGALKLAGDGCDTIFLSVDVDVVDHSEAPGVSAPSPGGLTASEILEGVFLASRDEKITGMDIVEIAPSLDTNGITSRLGATILLYFLGGKVKFG